MRHTRRPESARPAARFTLVVVFPTPPFWFITAILRMGFLSLETYGAQYTPDGKTAKEEPYSARAIITMPDEIGRPTRP